MANFLIYNKTHWTETPSKSVPENTGYQRQVNIISVSTDTPEVKAERLAALDRKYASRYIAGDVVEIRPDSRGMCGLEPLSFLLIKVPQITYANAVAYMDKVYAMDTNSRKYIKFASKYNVLLSGLTFDAAGTCTLTLKNIRDRITEKS